MSRIDREEPDRSESDPPATDSDGGMQAFQEGSYGQGCDYSSVSPHLKHRQLRDYLVDLLFDEVERTRRGGMPPTVLEIGAGHGGYTEPTLAFGCTVTATEMSRASLHHLRSRYGSNGAFRAVFDPDGSLDVLVSERYSLILCASVLHHIPDYIAFLDGPLLNHLAVGGSIVTFQDPLWYPRMRRLDVRLSQVAYLSWRLTQGSYLEGIRTRLRRLRGVHDEKNPRDMVEYHVVRDGVDEQSMVEVLAPRFDDVRLVPYWSTQAAFWQGLGRASARTNTFAVVATGFHG